MKYRESVKQNIEAFMIFTFNLELQYPLNFKETCIKIISVSDQLRELLITCLSPITEIFGTLVGGIDDSTYIHEQLKNMDNLEK